MGLQMDDAFKDLTRVGYVLGAFGVVGAVKIYVLGDAGQLRKLKRFWLEGRGWLKVEKLEVHVPAVVIKFAAISDRDAAEALKGINIYAHDTELPPLEEGEYYYHQLIGLAVFSPTGETLGEVVGVRDLGYGDALEVRRGLKVYLVPLQAPYVQVDLQGQPVPGIVIDAPAGLLDDSSG
jgi:16S rRNA processing protein RimM